MLIGWIYLLSSSRLISHCSGHLLGVGVGATETRATARLPGTITVSSGVDLPGDDRDTESHNKYHGPLILTNVPSLLMKVDGSQTVGSVG